VSFPELIPLHFGVFGFTGAGKSNLVSTPTRLALSRQQPNRHGRRIFKFVVFELMDEYTGLLIGQLVQHRWSGKSATSLCSSRRTAKLSTNPRTGRRSCRNLGNAHYAASRTASVTERVHPPAGAPNPRSQGLVLRAA
jgi:hypothetical protein